jgi:hypothetical protein
MNKQRREYALNKMNEKKQIVPEGYSAGGAAKVRKGEVTPSGKQIKTSSKKGRE